MLNTSPITVAQVMLAPAVTTHPGASIGDALRTMRQYGMPALVVTMLRPDARPGVVTQADAERALSRRAATQATVRDVMTSSPLLVAPAMRVEDCVTLMVATETRLAVVINGGQPVGIVRDTDLFQALEGRR